MGCEACKKKAKAPSPKYIYLIENENTHEWLTSGKKWTDKIHIAMKFMNTLSAASYAMRIKLSDWKITEQEVKK